MNKTVGAVTASGFDPAFLNVECDGEFPERVKVTVRGAKDIGNNQPHATAVFTKEEFALFLVRCQQTL